MALFHCGECGRLQLAPFLFAYGSPVNRQKSLVCRGCGRTVTQSAVVFFLARAGTFIALACALGLAKAWLDGRAEPLGPAVFIGLSVLAIVAFFPVHVLLASLLNLLAALVLGGARR